MAGVEVTGFVKKTFAEIKAELEASERADISPSLSLAPATVFGQVNGIVSDLLRQCWDVAEGVYRALYPNSAEGDALENICSITGIIRLDKTKSTVTVVATGTPATSIPIGSVISVQTTGDRFVTLATAVIGGGGTVSIDCESEEFGPIAAPAGTLTVIVTPVGGWDSVTNALDAVLGRNIETDVELRARRVQALFNPGGGTLESILAAVSGVSGVTSAFAFENVSLSTNSDGLPGKSFEIVVEGGDDVAICQAIFDNKPAGIFPYGTSDEDIVDSQGFSHDINFSRPTEVEMWISLTVVVNPAIFGGGIESEGVTLVKQALADFGDLLNIGDDVIALQFKCEPLVVPGVVDVTGFTIEDADPPLGTENFQIDSRGIAVFDTSRIVILVTPFEE